MSNIGAGPRGFPPIFIKSCIDLISYPLCIIYNKSLPEGIFQDVLKQAQIVRLREIIRV